MYLRGTIGFGLRYVRDDGVRLHGYSDLDWVGSAVDRKITLTKGIIQVDIGGHPPVPNSN
jgi:hypothetical protein